MALRTVSRSSDGMDGIIQSDTEDQGRPGVESARPSSDSSMRAVSHRQPAEAQNIGHQESTRSSDSGEADMQTSLSAPATAASVDGGRSPSTEFLYNPEQYMRNKLALVDAANRALESGVEQDLEFYATLITSRRSITPLALASVRDLSVYL